MTEQTKITIDVGQIPPELKALAQWVVWRKEQPNPNEKAKKVPCDPKTGRRASTTNPTTWGDFKTACDAFEQGGYDGIGYVFTKNDQFCGIDLDHCINPETGEIEPWAQVIVEKLDSYSEVSPSRTGLHILTKAQLPPGGRRKGQIEMYDTGRYFTMSAQHVDGTPCAVNDRQREVETLHREIFGPLKSDKAEHTTASASTLSDDEVLHRARYGKNAEKFESLWSGDCSDFPSQSEADLSLCSQLAYWTGRNAEQMDRLFRESGLFRDKWDEKHFSDGKTYGEATIEKALEGANEANMNDDTSHTTAEDRPWSQLDEAALSGLPGEIVRTIEPHTEADAVALLVHLLSEFFCVIGPGSRVLLDGTSNPLICNAVIVGKTSKARKGTAEKRMKRAIQRAIHDWTRGECRGNLSSGEGLVWAVRDSENDDPGITDKRLFLVQPEFGSTLKIMGREGNSLSGVIRDAWDGENLAPMTKNNRIKSTQPHVLIVAHVTEEELKKHLTST